MKKSLLFITVLVLVVSLFVSIGLTGCKTTSATAAETTKAAEVPAKKITVATITYTTEIEWFYILDQNYKIAADALGIELIQSDGKADPQTQVDLIETMTQKGVDAIIISPVDPAVIKAACEEAMKKGIFVLIQGQERATVPWSTANFGYNEADMGKLCGEIAAAGINEKFKDLAVVKVAVLGDPQWASSDVRMGGAKKALEDNVKGPKLEIVVDKVSAATIENATKVMESALQQNKDLRAVVGINDDAAIGAVAAFQSAGIDVVKECSIAGEGNNKGTWPYIDRGEILGSVDLNHKGTAEVALNAVVKLVKGEKVDEMMYIDMIKVTKENLSNWYKK